VSAEVEIEGLDIPEMGALAYPDFVMTPGPGGHISHQVEAPVGSPVLQPARGKH
jgi:hypothetical protein